MHAVVTSLQDEKGETNHTGVKITVYVQGLRRHVGAVFLLTVTKFPRGVLRCLFFVAERRGVSGSRARRRGPCFEKQRSTLN